MGVFFDTFLLDMATFLSIIIALIYYYLTSNDSYWEKRNVPFVKPEFFFGNMRDVITGKMCQSLKLDEFYWRYKKAGYRYGGFFQLRSPCFVPVSLDLMKDMFVKDFMSFHDRGFPYDEEMDPLSTHLISLDGAKWKYVRTKATPIFSTGKLKKMFPLMKDVTVTLLSVLEKLSEEEMVDIREVMAQFATDVIRTCAFGLQASSLTEKDEEFRKMGRNVFNFSRLQKFQQIISSVYPWAYKAFKLRMFSAETTDFFVGVVRDTMKYRKENNIVRHDVIDCLIEMQKTKGISMEGAEEIKGVENFNTAVDENAIRLTDEVLAAQAFVFFLAGFETSATTMSYCLFELAHQPEMQDKIVEEVKKMTERHGELNYDALQDLKYLGQVVDETLRKYPAATPIFRICTKSYKVDSNTTIEAGTRVFLPVYSIHHDPEFYPDPEKFDPERFSDENKDKIVPYSYAPFGAGPRTCIGMRFSIMEMKLALAVMLVKYRVMLCKKTKPIFFDSASIVLTPKDGVWLRIKKRD